MNKYTFKCGCSFNILKESESKDTLPYLDVDENNLPFCQKAWDLLSTGMTKGIFQLESDLGRTWCKKLKPENAEQLGALGAILRPGPLKSLDNEGISMTEHYCSRKNRGEEIKPYHPNVDKHLLGTYNNLIYQEQIIALSKELAGLSDAESDKLRKCLDGDTKFYSRKRGKVSIKELINSDYKSEEFLTVDENNNKVWKKIEKIWYTGKLKTYEVMYKYRGKLYSVICTGNHKILTSKGFIEASNLKKSDKIKFCLPNELVVYASVFLVKEDRDNNPVYDFTMEDKSIPWIWADYTFVHNCIPEDSTFISKQRGNISLKEMLNNGYKEDLFMTMDEKGNVYWDNISDLWFTKFDELYEIKTKTGLTIRCTQNHKILTNNGWKKTIDLDKNDFLITTRKEDYIGKDEICNELALVISGILCEGYCSGKRYSFVNHNEEMMNLFLDNASKIFKNKDINKNNKKVCYLNKDTKKILSKYIEDVLSKDKKIPKAMMDSSVEQCRKFLSFMLACEGGISNNGQFEFSSKSKIMINQVRDLLRRFGVVSFLKKKIVKKYGIYWRLYINDISSQKVLQKELTINWPETKKNQLDKIIKNKKGTGFTSDIVPKNISSKLMDDGCKVNEGPKNFKQRDCGFSKLKKIAHNDYWKKFANGNQYYDKVEYVKKTEKIEKVYDFSMKNTEMPQAIVNHIVIANSVGKKDQQLLAKIKKQFIEGCSNKKIISDKQAEEVWGWIEKSGRYCFNKSHAISYGLTGYDTAYLKSHFPIEFFANWLYYAKEKIKPQEEIRELVREAKSFDIKINLPDIRKMNEHFFTDRKEIWFGLTDIKDVGNATIQKFKQGIHGNDINNMSWFTFLTQYSNSLNIRALKALCYVGAFSWTGKTRNRLYNEVSAWQQLTEKEQDKLKEKSNLDDDLLKKMKELCKTVREGGICSNKNRVETVKSLVSILENPPNSEVDNNNFICWAEQNYLGCNLSVSKIDDCDTTMINSTLKEVIDGKTGYIVVGVEVKRVKGITTKTGKKMCFLEITDGTNSLDSVTVFPEQYKEFGYLFIEGNTLLLECQTDKKSKNLIVNKAYII